MEPHEYFTLAEQKINVADHLLSQTYPLLKDPKLLLSVIENINDALQAAVNGLVENELTWKRIDPRAAQARMLAFEKLAKKYDIPQTSVDLVETVASIIHDHKQAAVEFQRKTSFIISDDNYRLRALSADKIKAYLNQARPFVKSMKALVENHDRLTRRS